MGKTYEKRQVTKLVLNKVICDNKDCNEECTNTSIDILQKMSFCEHSELVKTICYNCWEKEFKDVEKKDDALVENSEQGCKKEFMKSSSYHAPFTCGEYHPLEDVIIYCDECRKSELHAPSDEEQIKKEIDKDYERRPTSSRRIKR